MNKTIKRWTMSLGVALVCVATLALAGDTPQTPPAKAAIPSVEVRFANVQRSMRENGIDFRPTVSIGDDGRLIVRVAPIDTLTQ